MDSDVTVLRSEVEGLVVEHTCLYRGDYIVIVTPYRTLSEHDFGYIRYLHSKGESRG